MLHPETGERTFTTDTGHVNYGLRLNGFRVERMLGFVLPPPQHCINPNPALYDTLQMLAQDEGPDRLLATTQAEIAQAIANGYRTPECVALVPRAGAANVVPLYRMWDPGPVNGCEEGKRCIRCFSMNCDMDGDYYAGYPCNDVIYVAYDKEDEDGDKKACPDGYLGDVELTECDRTCNAFWEEHARGYRLTPAARELAATQWEASLAGIHPHRYEITNGLDDDCDFQVDELEHEYPFSGRDDIVREYPWVLMQAKVRDIAARAVTLRARAYRLDDFENEFQVFGSAPPPSATLCATTTLSSAQRVEAVVGACGGKSGGPVPQHTATNVIVLAFVDASGNQYLSVDDTGQLSVVPAGRLADQLRADPFIQASHPSSLSTTERALTHAQFVNQALYEWNLSQHEGQTGFQDIPGREWPMGTRYGAAYGELWCSEFASSMLLTVSADAPSCTSVGCFWDFYILESVFGHGASPEGYAPWQAGDACVAALRGGIAEPGDYLAMSGGTKGTHSGLFLGYSGTMDAVWHVGGNESHARVCSPDLHQCGTSAVFVAAQPTLRGADEGDPYHDMVGLGWWMQRR
jgi:hypothetical protein